MLYPALATFVKNDLVKTGVELRVIPILSYLVGSSEDEFAVLIAPLVNVYELLDASKQKLVEFWFGGFPKKDLITLIDSMKDIISLRFLQANHEDHAEFKGLEPFLNFLKMLYRGNVRTNTVSCEEFYIDVIPEEIELADEIQTWMRNKKSSLPNEFTFIDYPWVLECAYKSKILEIESKIEKEKELMNSYMNLMNNINISFLLGGQDAVAQVLYLKLNVRRENLIEDTLNQLSSSGLNLKKPLKVP